MNNLVIYDSIYGNTKLIAEAIVKSISANIININDLKNSDLDNLDLLVIGSPTLGGQATQKIQQFAKDLPKEFFKNTKVAIFDTRFLEKDLNFALKLLVKTIGYAAPKIAKVLSNKSAKIIVSPEGFIVKGKEGPLAPGELDRAKDWLKNFKYYKFTK